MCPILLSFVQVVIYYIITVILHLRYGKIPYSKLVNRHCYIVCTEIRSFFSCYTRVISSLFTTIYVIYHQGISQQHSMLVPISGKQGSKPENSAYHLFKKGALPSHFLLLIQLLKINPDSCSKCLTQQLSVSLVR